MSEYSGKGLSREGNQGSEYGSEYEGQEGPLGRDYIVCVQPNVSFSCLVGSLNKQHST